MGKQASFRFLFFEKFPNSSLTIFFKFIFFKFNYRQQLLSQSLNLQMFNRDAKQAEVLLSQQEHLLSKDETPQNLEQAESLIKVSTNIIFFIFFKKYMLFLTYLLMLFKSCYYYSRATIIADNCFAVYQSPRRKLYQSPRRKYRAVIYLFGLASTFKVHTYYCFFCIFCNCLYNKVHLI